MKKVLDTEFIKNELEGASLFFSPPSGKSKKRLSESKKETTQRTNERSNVPTFERTKQRSKIRHTFDIYEDQLYSLKEIQLRKERESGEKVLLGGLVQRALDKLIESERNNERSNVGTNERS